MDPITGGLAALGLLSAWVAAGRALYRAESSADEVHYVRADDGWRIALSRYRPQAPVRRHPVLLCHGLASNHLIFDMGPQRSLARFLAARGYEVWALELRGHGRSDRPGAFSGRRYGWSYDDYLKRDVAAALDHVLDRPVRDGLPAPGGVHWIGHSMGGLLLYCVLSQGGSARVRSGIALGSSLDYSGSPSGFHATRRLVALTRLVPAVPLGAMCLLLAPLSGRVANPLERFLLWPSNVEPGTIRRLVATGYHAVSAPVLAQLATAMTPGGLCSVDGACRYYEGLASATSPVLAVAGDQDRQCAPEAARRTLEALGSADRKLMVLGKQHGQRDHYGHCDLVIGRNALHEVYPRLLEWLDTHDA
jgi:pimeloyl-ACP methyl ester carboxylesterase